MYAIKPLEELTFTDDYMFGAVMHNAEICAEVIERLLHIKVDHVEYPELQKVLKPYYTSKGVRLDVYVKDSDRVIDIELQNKKFDALGKRTRYYQSMLDMDALMSGSDYSELKESYVLFICNHDPFNKNLPCYTFKNICTENSTVELADKAVKVFYNATAYEEEKDPQVYNFLQFVCKNSASDSLTERITSLVERLKLQEEFKTEYAAVNLHDRDIRKEALEEGRIQGISQKAKDSALNLLNMHLGTPEQIAEATGLTVEEVLALKKEMA